MSGIAWMETSSDLLAKILQVLTSIEQKLDAHDAQFKELGSLVKNKGTKSESVIEHVETADETRIDPVLPPDSRHQSRIAYTTWKETNHEGYFNDEICKKLQVHLGDWWRVPYDTRLPLSFSKHVNNALHEYGLLSIDGRLPTHYSTNKIKEALVYDSMHRRTPGNDFLVIDFDSQNNHRIYRMGETALGHELTVESEYCDSAPWSRLIVYQGMTTGEILDRSRRASKGGFGQPIPYFGRLGVRAELWSHIQTHCLNMSRNVTTNPYSKPGLGFSTTFYEIIKTTDANKEPLTERWPHGPLYDDPLKRHFRKCTYTLYAMDPTVRGDDPEITVLTPGHWTIVLLCPSHFFDETNRSFPMTDTPQTELISIHRIGRLTKLGAEMNLISQGLQRISARWADFQTFFDYILDNGESLMRPTEHDNLLFDDGAFSRSRRYFWAIDCLTEFETSITGNMLQWELWKKARLDHYLGHVDFSSNDRFQYKLAEKHYRILQNQRQYFSQKLASTKALRDALFTASAVIESRASTRLGKNVKLLTFVSIFFLPLSFCTSLWSMNNMFPIYGFLYTIIAVGLSTYLIVFNLNTIVTSISDIYDSRKRHLIRAMKADSAPSWKRLGEQFEVFRPRHERLEPSEWYVPLYALTHPWVLLGLPWPRRNSDDAKLGSDEKAGSSTRRTWRLFGREKVKPPEREEEGWVM